MNISSMPVPFMKLSGTGNDFIVIDNRNGLIQAQEMSEFARLVCRRKFSVGADGLILLENSSNADFRWQFFNGDGSVAEMCGNGARCAARFANLQGIAPETMHFETLAGVIEAKVEASEVSVKMTPPKDIRLNRELEVDGRKISYHFIDTGVPHVLIFSDDIKNAPICELGRPIRFHSEFQPAGTNVNFVGRLPGSLLHVRTYERGVEDETFACGTGATACALVGAMLGREKSPVEIVTSGGDRLTIIFTLVDGNQAENVFLKGPAHVIYQGEINAEALIEG